MSLEEDVQALNWPIIYGDRLRTEGHVGPVTADVGVVYFWTAAEKLLGSHGALGTVLNVDHPRLSVASNLYSAQSGLNYMLLNIAANPHIRHIVMLGSEGTKDFRTDSGKSLRSFFKNGVTDEGAFIGNERFGIDAGIPVDVARQLSEYVTIHDVAGNGSLAEQVTSVNKLLDELPQEEPSREIVQLELSKPKGGILPYEGGPVIVRGQYVGEVWLKLLHQIMTYGGESLMEQVPEGEEGRRVREINGLVAVINGEDPDNPRLKPYEFMNMGIEGIRDYSDKQILSPTIPPELKYAYGPKLRSRDVITDWPLRVEQGEPVPGTDYRRVTIDQVVEAVQVLNEDRFSKNAVMITWQPDRELTAKRDSSPCAVYVHPLLKDGKLNMNLTFRSHDMFEGWPLNAFGFLALQKYIATRVRGPDGEPIHPGLLTITSDSAQIYQKNWTDAEKVLEEHFKFIECIDDPRGYYAISVEGANAVVSHFDSGGQQLRELSGDPRKLRDELSVTGPSNAPHLQYLGWELSKAAIAIAHSDRFRYVQDQPLKEVD